MPMTETAIVRCVECRSEYQPGRAGSILCPECGGAAWVSAAITLAPELNDPPADTAA